MDVLMLNYASHWSTLTLRSLKLNVSCCSLLFKLKKSFRFIFAKETLNIFSNLRGGITVTVRFPPAIRCLESSSGGHRGRLREMPVSLSFPSHA